jgi:hypothetical protein
VAKGKIDDDVLLLLYHWLARLVKDISATSFGIVDFNREKNRGQAYFGGVRGKESEYNPDENTQYSIGSLTKLFVALAIHQLIAEGKISLNDLIEQYLKPPMGRPQMFAAITVKHLLTHTAGLAREGGFQIQELEYPPKDVTYYIADPKKAYKEWSSEEGSGFYYSYPGSRFDLFEFWLSVAWEAGRRSIRYAICRVCAKANFRDTRDERYGFNRQLEKSPFAIHKGLFSCAR